MFRAHELIAVLRRDTQDYTDCVAAIKFDLGHYDRITEMYEVSRKEFYELPAPLCLFQVTQEMDLHFFLAKVTDHGSVWRRFGKIIADGFKWVQEDVEMLITSDGEISARRVSDKFQLLTEGIIRESEFGSLSETTRWTLARCVEVACAVEVFSCSNVVTVEHAPPKMLNAKRSAKGKAPFFSYRTIHIADRHKHSDSAQGRGTHASPRLHLRRGHIRRLEDGRRVWVTAHLVGDKSKGFASHGYDLRDRTT